MSPESIGYNPDSENNNVVDWIASFDNVEVTFGYPSQIDDTEDWGRILPAAVETPIPVDSSRIKEADTSSLVKILFALNSIFNDDDSIISTTKFSTAHNIHTEIMSQKQSVGLSSVASVVRILNPAFSLENRIFKAENIKVNLIDENEESVTAQIDENLRVFIQKRKNEGEKSPYNENYTITLIRKNELAPADAMEFYFGCIDTDCTELVAIRVSKGETKWAGDLVAMGKAVIPSKQVLYQRMPDSEAPDLVAFTQEFFASTKAAA